VPETIGAIVFISRNLQELRANTVAGFVLTCLGDERAYSYLPSRLGNTLADRVALYVLENFAPQFKKYTFLDRGSDERQYCSPGIDLPVCSVMRSKYATYPEYHTSLDDLSFVTPEGLAGGYSILRRCLEILEENYRYRTTIIGEPQLGRRNLYPQLSRLGSYDEETRLLKDVLTYCDGDHDLIALANRLRRPATSVVAACRRLQSAGLIAT
jgi:aminopeptidase-like protein